MIWNWHHRHWAWLNRQQICITKPDLIIIVVDGDRFYIAQLSALEQVHCALVACGSEWVIAAFYSAFEYPPTWCTYSAVWLLHGMVPRETAAVSARSVYTIQPCTTLQCHFIPSHIRIRVHACLAVTCHLHFGQNDRDLLPAIAVTRGWNGYRNK